MGKISWLSDVGGDDDEDLMPRTIIKSKVTFEKTEYISYVLYTLQVEVP